MKIPEFDFNEKTAEIYAYDIQDHFHDIRSNSRIAQLHMASILAATNMNLRDSVIRMTPIQYSLKLMFSCFNNQPLSEK